MQPNKTFSIQRVALILGLLGLLLGAIVLGRPVNAHPISAQPSAITADQAKAIVESAYPGKAVTEVEPDDAGRNAYEVELDNGLEVIVDASTGAIVDTAVETKGGKEK